MMSSGFSFYVCVNTTLPRLNTIPQKKNKKWGFHIFSGLILQPSLFLRLVYFSVILVNTAFLTFFIYLIIT